MARPDNKAYYNEQKARDMHHLLTEKLGAAGMEPVPSRMFIPHVTRT
jgi:2'-5' RNA ligase